MRHFVTHDLFYYPTPSHRTSMPLTESPGSSRSNSPAPSPRTNSPRTTDPTDVLAASPLDANNPKSSSQSDLAKILDLLSDVIQNDCRFRVAQPRPSRPPAALQSVVLDLATLLVKQDPLNPPWLYDLGIVMLPAFDCFEQGAMMGRVVAFYIDWIVPQLIASKEENAGKRGRASRKEGELNGTNSVEERQEREKFGRIFFLTDLSGIGYPCYMACLLKAMLI